MKILYISETFASLDIKSLSIQPIIPFALNTILAQSAGAVEYTDYISTER